MPTCNAAIPRRKDEGCEIIGPGIVKKDWNYYKRNGAIWTDPSHHTPPERMQLITRKGEENHKMEEELLEARREVAEIEKQAVVYNRREFRAKQLQKMEKQMKRNRERIADSPTVSPCSSSNSSSSNESSSEDECDSKRVDEEGNSRFIEPGIIQKDWKYYRKNDNQVGAIWNDPIVHTPENRMHLVISQKRIEDDRRTMDVIQDRLREEHEKEEKELDKKLERVQNIRHAFLKQGESGEKWADKYSMYKRTDAKKSRETSSKESDENEYNDDQQQQQKKMKERESHPSKSRLDELSKPKKPLARLKDETTGGDFAGLYAASTDKEVQKLISKIDLQGDSTEKRRRSANPGSKLQSSPNKARSSETRPPTLKSLTNESSSKVPQKEAWTSSKPRKQQGKEKSAQNQLASLDDFEKHVERYRPPDGVQRFTSGEWS